MKSINNYFKYDWKKLFKPKSIIIIVLIFFVFLIVSLLFRHIHLQNMKYREINEDANVDIDWESVIIEDEKQSDNTESLKMNEQKQEVERDYRGDTLMIF
jgi:regulatory protein YycI of two-component signal transduction system YycFG